MIWRRKKKRRGASAFEGLALSKGIAPREAREAEESATELARIRLIRGLVMNREKGECRCCREYFNRRQAAQSMHEIQPRSTGGIVSLENSIAVCGSGTSGCHGELQANRIRVEKRTLAGARGLLRFYQGEAA